MRSKLKAGFVLAVVFVCASVPMFAHHGTNTSYDTSKRVTLTGTVTQFVWQNPHCVILFDVTDDKGNVTHWGAEENAPGNLARQGWTKTIMKPGDKITITGAPSKAGEPRMVDDHIVLADGRVLKGVATPVGQKGVEEGPKYEQ